MTANASHWCDNPYDLQDSILLCIGGLSATNRRQRLSACPGLSSGGMRGEFERSALVMQGDNLVTTEREFGVGLSVFVGEFDFIDSVAEKLYESAYFPLPKFSGGLIFQQRNRIQQGYVRIHVLHLRFMT